MTAKNPIWRTLQDLESGLAEHAPRRIPLEGAMRQAAVAAVFREHTELELLFIRRAEHPKDPWSGHMAFPGGRVDPEDADPLSAARRETHEEVGVDLSGSSRLIAELSRVPAVARSKPMPLMIFPFVFALEKDIELRPNPREVQEALWVPWSHLEDEARRARMPYRAAGVKMTLPCVPYEGRVIWGLTLKMVDELRSLAR